jgi:hypothetical protein
MRKTKPFAAGKLSRRELMRACAAAPLAAESLPVAPASPARLHAFDAWLAERRQLEFALDRTPEDKDPAGRERLFDRVFELERLILTTHSNELAGIRAKAAMLVWLMEMDGSDGLAAMKHIRTYLEGCL